MDQRFLLLEAEWPDERAFGTKTKFGRAFGKGRG